MKKKTKPSILIPTWSWTQPPSRFENDDHYTTCEDYFWNTKLGSQLFQLQMSVLFFNLFLTKLNRKTSFDDVLELDVDNILMTVYENDLIGIQFCR